MPPDPDLVDPPRQAAEILGRYHRLERIASGAFALLAAGVVAAAVLLLPLLHALAAALVLLAVVRAPVFRSHGSARLATDADPDEVRDDFAGPTPPVLATQWGVADAIRRTDDGAVYEHGYLFGLRSVTLEVEARDGPTADPVDGLAGPHADLEVVVTADGRPWARYAASIDERDGRTTADVAFASEGRFALRRLPQWLLAQRYRDEVLAAQGYDVLELDVGLSVR